MPLLCCDCIFKTVFADEENLLVKMVSDIIGIDNELLKFVLRILDDKIIKLELNANKYAGLVIKNLS